MYDVGAFSHPGEHYLEAGSGGLSIFFYIIEADNAQALEFQPLEVCFLVTETTSAQFFEERVMTNGPLRLSPCRLQVKRNQMAAVQKIAEIRRSQGELVRELFLNKGLNPYRTSPSKLRGQAF